MARPYLVLATLWLTIASALHSAACAEVLPLEYFARLPQVRDGELSQDGRHAVMRVEKNGAYVTAVFGYDGEKISYLQGIQETEEYKTLWTHWANPERLLVSIGFADKRQFTETFESRLISLSIDDFKMKPLFRSEDGWPVQIQDRIVSFLPKDPNHLLVEYSGQASWPSVYQVRVDSHRHKLVQRFKTGVRDWRADRDGEVRIGIGTKDEKTPYMVMRPAGTDDWIDYSHLKQQPGVGFYPLSFSPLPNRVYVVSNHDTEPAGLFLFNVASGEFEDLIYRHPTADVVGLRTNPTTGQLRGVIYSGDTPAVHWMDPGTQALDDEMSRALGGARIFIGNQTPDRRFAFLEATKSSEPGAYYLWDEEKRALRLVSPLYPELEGQTLGEVIQTRYEARDGLSIPAYVTLPPGLADLNAARARPAVVLPHGGPHARDYGDFDYWAQFLANRGYVVLQMNFRGSAGYGAAFQAAGYREWGEAMQDDIEDGARWLVSIGVADPARLAIMGGSYGGYAALMGAVKTPNLFQCAVSVNGVTDLPALLRHEQKFVGGRYANRHIGNLYKDRKKLITNSPARNAEKVQKPVLLIHGDQDRVVPIAQSNKMARALRGADKDVRYVKLEDGDHSISLYENRLIFLDEVEKFLGPCLGAP